MSQSNGAKVWGIAQANELMTTLAVTDREDLVLRVIRRTLESVGVHVDELIAEARSREGDLRTQIGERHRVIAKLEGHIQAERAAISELESDLALTGRTREGLERSEMGGLGTRSPDSDRPTALAVPKGLPETVLRDSDIESLPPDEPVWPPATPKQTATKS
jgi:hypothetical protein